ncbi:mevalonate kinase family protein [Catalinimonas niigatensis]|uniref:mevalonate kinase family protein n=1 Tax=Catalinimonas niigatensis TaxID=1397264 RepID=UPI002666CCDF|nr:GHMP kinase [Catalinimonas niigatensis]WPP48059.1 GHMP kinase [Catalinimonas niigatensis]
MDHAIIETSAYARAGLLGNPTDGYFGKTISIIVRNFGARILLYPSPELHIEAQEQDVNIFRNIYHLVDSVKLTGYYGGSRLIKATIKRFGEYCETNHIKLSNKNFTIRYHSSIPRQVGLAGSSAIVTATMRALMKYYEVEIPIEILPSIILSAEAEELGINAGLQDRVAQVYEGCVFMDFNKNIIQKKGHGVYERLDPSLLPNLYLAYKTDLSKVSGAVFNNIKARFEKGDEEVIKTIGEIANLAEEGKVAIQERNYNKLNELINHNFDLRCKIMNISQSNMDLVYAARKCGASAKFTGSGGSIIGIYENDEVLNKLVIELKKINARVVKPYIV